MLPIEKLEDAEFMKDLFWKKRKQIDPRIKKIIDLSYKRIKFYQEKDFQHAVINYLLRFFDHVDWQQYLKIYASAHSDGSRARTFKIMQHIHSHGFGLREKYSSTKPLFYYPPLKSSFHQELMGENLIYVYKNHPGLLPAAAAEAGVCLAKFHALPLPADPPLKRYPLNNKQLDPSKIIKRTKDAFLAEKTFIQKAFQEIMIFFDSHPHLFKNTVFSHGDFHLENIIIGAVFEMKPIKIKKVGIIDYTDVCYADRGLDLGSFMQKLLFIADYKLKLSLKQKDELAGGFLRAYQKHAELPSSDHLLPSITFWQTWNALRVLTNYLLYDKPEAIQILTLFIRHNLRLLEKMR